MESSSPKVPPHSLEAEAAVLGGMLLDNTALDRVAEVISADDFYRDAHRKIFRAGTELSQRSEPIDLLTLSEALKVRGELAEVGGAGYISELADRAVSVANIQYHARIVREKAILRGLIATAQEIVARGYEAREAVGQFVDEAEQAIYQIAEKKARGSFVRVGDMAGALPTRPLPGVNWGRISSLRFSTIKDSRRRPSARSTSSCTSSMSNGLVR